MGLEKNKDVRIESRNTWVRAMRCDVAYDGRDGATWVVDPPGSRDEDYYNIKSRREWRQMEIRHS